MYILVICIKNTYYFGSIIRVKDKKNLDSQKLKWKKPGIWEKIKQILKGPNCPPMEAVTEPQQKQDDICEWVSQQSVMVWWCSPSPCICSDNYTDPSLTQIKEKCPTPRPTKSLTVSSSHLKKQHLSPSVSVWQHFRKKMSVECFWWIRLFLLPESQGNTVG